MFNSSELFFFFEMPLLPGWVRVAAVAVGVEGSMGWGGGETHNQIGEGGEWKRLASGCVSS